MIFENLLFHTEPIGDVKKARQEKNIKKSGKDQKEFSVAPPRVKKIFEILCVRVLRPRAYLDIYEMT